MKRSGALLASLVAAALGCSAPPKPAATPGGDARVLVYFPPGACGGELELELYDRAAGAWRPHPEHPRLAPGSCALESPERLLNELRVRCADPAGLRGPSEWVVGAALPSGGAPSPCADRAE
jgi:hypothetical protein